MSTIPNTIDRRLRVMLRFANFCLVVMQRLSVRTQMTDGSDVTKGLCTVFAAIRISKAAVLLVNYAKNPKPARPSSLSQTPVQSSRDDRVQAPSMLSMASNLTGNHLDEDKGSTAATLAERIARKAREMIRRDRLFRFGPSPQIFAGGDQQNIVSISSDCDQPSISKPIGQSVLLSTASRPTIAPILARARRLPP